MKKFPKVKRLGDDSVEDILEDTHMVEVQEKVDGANFRFTYLEDEDRLVFGSRNVEYYHDGNQPLTWKRRAQYKLGELMEHVLLGNIETEKENHVDGNFRHAIEYVRENINLNALKQYQSVHGPVTFFGEAMHPHTIDYEWDDVPSFLGFDVYSEEYEGWAHPDEVQRIYNELGLPTVPRLYLGYPDGYDFDGDIPESKFYDGPAEGIVIKNQTGQMAKLRSEEFKEVSNTGSQNSSDAEDPDEIQLAEQYATEARVLKEIHKMEDEGYVVEMSMMKDLWHRVFEDIIEEEFDTIFLGRYTLNTKDFRSEVASRTANILESYLSRPEGSVLNEAQA